MSIRLLIAASGLAALSWEVLWQLRSTLALGASARGTAITLAVTMGGMSLGAFLMGRAPRARRPLRVYAGLEAAIALCGLLLGPAFSALERLDSAAFSSWPGGGSLVHLLGIAAALGVPAMAMGATLPVFGAICEERGLSLAELYGLNTIGAAAGVLAAALILIPVLGVARAGWLIAAVNAAVAWAAWRLPAAPAAPPAPARAPTSEPLPARDLLVVAVSGCATLALEVSWFRSLASTFPNTTDVFALMLACVLLALGLAAREAARLKRAGAALGPRLAAAGALILLGTPLVERLDLLRSGFLTLAGGSLVGPLEPGSYALSWTAVAVYGFGTLAQALAIFWIVAPPMLLLGLAFPWTVEDRRPAAHLGALYAANTLAAIGGALGAAWVFLPVLGFARTAWLCGAAVALVGTLLCARRGPWACLAAAALAAAALFESGVGRTRVQGPYARMGGVPARVLASREGPDATVSVVEYDDGGRRLLINSSSASGESGGRYALGEAYMAWMGRLPMLARPGAQDALVICMGTGQTANAVREAGASSLDVVDIDASVFELAHHFRSNKGVLQDPRVSAIVMDGRAHLRRSSRTYDVLTLEPMPPHAAGVNALYSREFYELARARLGPDGVIAQWLPFHSVSPRSAASIARTFQEVFPEALLWIDPASPGDAILLGSAQRLSLPALARSRVALWPEQLRRYGRHGAVITDDNQLLAYGAALYSYRGLLEENLELVRRSSPQEL